MGYSDYAEVSHELGGCGFQFESVFQRGFARYEKDRNIADMECSTSKLSPRLRIGTLSPNELYNKVENSDLEDVDRNTFTRRLLLFWRDPAYFYLSRDAR